MSCAIEFDKIGVRGELADIVCRLGSVAAKLSFEISLGALEGDLAAGVGENAGGDGQKALDVIADDYFFAALKDTSVKYYASEEQDDAVIANENGAYGLAIDPLDGSSNIDVNVSIGTIFSIMPAFETAEATFLREGHEQLAAGYFVFGPQTALVITFGEGTHQFIYDRRAERYRYVGPMSIATKTKEFAINASNHRHWPVPIRSYVDDCLAGKTGPRDENYNMRWIASLVAETHRILCRGGVFLYPGDDRDGYAKGRLRMVYECAPIAMIVEQAGGQATNAEERLLDQKVDTLHGRTGLVFGSAEEVERVAHYHSLPPSETSPLFGNRGLFALI